MWRSFGGLAAEPCEDQGRAIPILDMGGVDIAYDQVSAGIGDDVAFSTLDALARGTHM